MPAGLRDIKRRRASVQSTKKITRAMELISASRVQKAQQAAAAALPYANAITSALSELSSNGADLTNSYLQERPQVRNAAVIVVTSDRGLAGPYSSSVLKQAEELITRLRSEGVTPKLYVTGRKGVAYFKFRNRAMEGTWTGFSDQPHYENAKAVADDAIQAFMNEAVDEIYTVYTHFVNSLKQEAQVRRFLPLEVVEQVRPETVQRPPAYEYEPDANTVLSALLPRYIESRLFTAYLEAAASEHAARRRAMSTATENASGLIDDLSREYNAARQAAITQELTEMVGATMTPAGS